MFIGRLCETRFMRLKWNSNVTDIFLRSSRGLCSLWVLICEQQKKKKKKKRWSYSENGFYQFLADLVYGPILSITLTKSSKNSKFNTYCSCVVRWHESMTTPDIIPGSPGHMVRLFLDGIERERKGIRLFQTIPPQPNHRSGASRPRLVPMVSFARASPRRM